MTGYYQGQLFTFVFKYLIKTGCGCQGIGAIKVPLISGRMP